MHPSESSSESIRVLGLCNACRYCEGFCALFPAIEGRNVIAEAELHYLSNLCHDCRACFYACPFTPPHPFAVNVPATLAKARLGSYLKFAWPRQGGARLAASTAVPWLITMLALMAPILSHLVAPGGGWIAAPSTRPIPFYEVVPYLGMVLPALAVFLYAGVSMWISGVRFWRAIAPPLAATGQRQALAAACADALTLRFLSGGGQGCNYPVHRSSHLRRWGHHGILAGFVLCFAASGFAALYHHLLGLQPPYPWLSWPVLAGTAGGVLLLAGGSLNLLLKWRSDRAPAAAALRDLDYLLLIQLLLTSATGLALVVMRETSYMPLLLVLHLAIVLALLLSLPHGKFVHWVYRVLALLRFRMENTPHRGPSV